MSLVIALIVFVQPPQAPPLESRIVILEKKTASSEKENAYWRDAFNTRLVALEGKKTNAEKWTEYHGRKETTFSGNWSAPTANQPDGSFKAGPGSEPATAPPVQYQTTWELVPVQSCSRRGGCQTVMEYRQVWRPVQTQVQAAPAATATASPDGFSVATGNPVVFGHGAMAEWMPDGTIKAFVGGPGTVTKTQPPNSRWRRDATGKWVPTETQTEIEVKEKKNKTITTIKTRTTTAALDEVNARRARRGLRPFIFDEGLTQAAEQCAAIRASRFIDGHLPNDFAYLPPGSTASAAGCGALEPSWGWGTCCMDDNYTYAGAGLVMGANGKRYMHLFVR